MKKKVFRISSIFIASTFLIMAWGSGSVENKNEEVNQNIENKDNVQETTKPKEKISCYVCGKDLTNEINKIEPMSTPGTWYCTPCYKSTMDEINEKLDMQGY